jgi:hypothetical protein
MEPNKRLVSESVEPSFGYSFGCFESKLVSQVTLIEPILFSKTQYFLQIGAFLEAILQLEIMLA